MCILDEETRRDTKEGSMVVGLVNFDQSSASTNEEELK